jgi:uncharacterized delta-60 repeat protein
MRRIALISLLALVASLLALPMPVHAAATLTPDEGYGDGGVATLPLQGEDEDFQWGHAGAVDQLGRTVVQFLADDPETGHPGVVARLESDGGLDPDFGGDGKVEVPVVAMSVAASTKGVAVSNLDAGEPGDVLAVRLNEDGTLDDRFADGGYLRAAEADLLGTDVVLDAAGALTVAVAKDPAGAGPWVSTLMRFREDGEPEVGFGGDGVVSAAELGLVEIGYLTYDGQGRLYAVAWGSDSNDGYAIRLTSAGTLDPTYGRGGRSPVLDVRPYDLHISTADGSALVSGFGDGTQEAVQRLTPAGFADVRFGSDGVFVVPTENGRVEAVALPSGYVVVRESNRCILLDRSGTPVGEATWDVDADRPFSFHSLWTDPAGGVIAASTESSGGTDDPAPVTVRRFVVAAPSLAPAVTSIERLDGALSVEWAAPESVPAAHPVRTYHVLALDGGEVASQAVVAGDVRQASLEGVSNGEAYDVVVVGYDDVGTIPASAPFAVPAGSGDLPDPSPAPAVSGVEVVSGRGSATVSWDPPQDDGGSTIWGYAVVALRHSDGSFAQWRNVRADVRSATLPGLANGTAYDVYVFAVTTEGFGALGSSAAVTPSAAAPAPAAPQMSWVSVVPIGAHAVVTWGPATERGEVTSAVHVIVIEDGAMAGWKAMTSYDRQVVVPAGPGAQVFVVAQSASGFGPLTGPVAVPA